MGHSFIWKLICDISVCNTLIVGVHLSSTPSISGPGSATGIPHDLLLANLQAYWVSKTSCNLLAKKVSENDQEIPQSQTTDNPVAPRGRAAQPS